MDPIYEAYQQSINEAKKPVLRDFMSAFEKSKKKILADVKKKGQEEGLWFEIAQDHIYDAMGSGYDYGDGGDIVEFLSDKDFDKLQMAIADYLMKNGIELD